MSDRATRDFRLVEASAACLDVTTGNAMATICVIQKSARERERQSRQVEAVREMVARFIDHTMTLQAFMIDYSPTMTEEALRAWAADLNKAVTS